VKNLIQVARWAAIVSAAALAGYFAADPLPFVGALRFAWIAHAQTSTTTSIGISLSFTGTATGVFGVGNTPILQGSGSIAPFGAAGLNATGSTFIFTFADGDTITTQAAESGKGSSITASLTILSGTGMFAGAGGTAQLALNCSADCGGQSGTGFAAPFTGSGTGTLNLPDSGTSEIMGLMLSDDQITLTATEQQIQSSALTITRGVQNQNKTQNKAFQTGGSFNTTSITPTPTLTVTPSSGNIPPSSSTTLTVTAGPANLSPGTYQGTVTITSGSDTSPSQIVRAVHFPQPAQTSDMTTQTVNVDLLITSAEATLALSQSGLSFAVAAGGPPLPSESLVLTSTGSSPALFSTSVSTLTGGSWLSVAPASGTVSAGASAAVNVAINASGLAPGDYFARVDFSAPTAGNSPQSAEVVLRVMSATTVDQVDPSGLIFVSGAGGASPSAQTVQVLDFGSQALTVSTSVPLGSAWLSASAGGTAMPGTPLSLAVTANTAGMAGGVYQGVMNVNIAQDGSTHPVSVVLVIPQSGTAVPELTGVRAGPEASAGCAPTQLLGEFITPGAGFQAEVGLPVPLQALVVDDCGNPLTSGTVSTSFSSGDPSVSMLPVGNGQWAGTWLPHPMGGPTTVSLFANSLSPPLAGTAQVSAQSSANSTTPIVSFGGETSAASFAGNTALAPGALISIFGSNLATGLTESVSLPFLTELAGTQVVLGGEVLPLQFVNSLQINAIVPYDLPVNAQLQLLVEQNGASSLPETVILAPAQPAVFTQNQSGQGAGAIADVKPNGSQFVVTSAQPASGGDALEIYCAGLGAVSPAVSSGAAASLTVLSRTVNPVTVTIGGQSAQVLFAGLAPGYAGLYQVDAVVPGGITASADVPVVLSVAGASSPPVTVSIQ